MVLPGESVGGGFAGCFGFSCVVVADSRGWILMQIRFCVDSVCLLSN